MPSTIQRPSTFIIIKDTDAPAKKLSMTWSLNLAHVGLYRRKKNVPKLQDISVQPNKEYKKTIIRAKAKKGQLM